MFTNAQSLKKAKFDISSQVNNSRTTLAKASKSGVVLRLELANMFPKSGVQTAHFLKTYFDLNSWVYISRATTARASKFSTPEQVTVG